LKTQREAATHSEFSQIFPEEQSPSLQQPNRLQMGTHALLSQTSPRGHCLSVVHCGKGVSTVTTSLPCSEGVSTVTVSPVVVLLSGVSVTGGVTTVSETGSVGLLVVGLSVVGLSLVGLPVVGLSVVGVLGLSVLGFSVVLSVLGLFVAGKQAPMVSPCFK
jgi:hypothetical protein